jgi:hypothetical protein
LAQGNEHLDDADVDIGTGAKKRKRPKKEKSKSKKLQANPMSEGDEVDVPKVSLNPPLLIFPRPLLTYSNRHRHTTKPYSP